MTQAAASVTTDSLAADRIQRGVTLILIAAFASFLLSVILWFAGGPAVRPVRRPLGPVDPGRRGLLDDRHGPASMTAVNILLVILGSGITLMVGVGMVLLTPRGLEDHAETPELQQPEPREGTGSLARPRRDRAAVAHIGGARPARDPAVAWRSGGDVSAVDGDDRAEDEARAGGGEEGDHVGDLLGPGDPPDRM